MNTTDTPILSIRGLAKRFGGVAAVSGIDLDVAARETVAIIERHAASEASIAAWASSGC